MFYNVTESSGMGYNYPGIQESYTSTEDAATILYEAQQNDYALFEGLIMSDFAEVQKRNSGAFTEGEISVLNENVLTDAWGKIKELFKKLWAKIKAIFNKFIVFISGVFVRDNKKLVELHSDKIARKDTSKLKVDWQAPGKIKSPSAFAKSFKAGVEKEFTFNALKSAFGNAIYINSDDIEKQSDAAIARAIGNKDYATMSSADLAKEFFAKTTQVKFDSIESQVRAILLDGKEPLTEAKNSQKELEELMKNCIDEISSAEKDAKDDESSADAKTFKAGSKAHLSAVKKLATDIQTATTKVTGATITAIKTNMKQARKAWLKAAAYNPKNEYAFNNIDAIAISEAVDFEFETDYDSFCYEG